ncbi:MAG: hypothetical protein PF450_01100, partial [Bacteroidales bacterium]|nr:hypothetical protein [Bacteroidales bacterium]
MPTLNTHSRLLLIWIIVSLSTSLTASVSDISFRRITINDGLSLSSVYAIYQDTKGFMWFATEDGLNKYDGKNFTIYSNTPGDLNTLCDKWIEIITEDDKGMLWLGSRNGLTRLDPTTDRMIRYKMNATNEHSISNDTIMTLINHGDYMWVGTQNGLCRIHT